MKDKIIDIISDNVPSDNIPSDTPTTNAIKDNKIISQINIKNYI